MLVPTVAQGAAGELAELLSACDAAVSWLAGRSRSVVVVGAGPVPRVHPDGAAGTLSGFGVNVRAGGAGPAVLPLSLTLGAWLLDRVGTDLRREYVEVGATDPAPSTLAGAQAMLVMGDGTARLNARAPGGLDDRAAGYEERIAVALATGDAATLAGLDRAEGEQLMAAGVPAWRAAGAAVLGRSPAHDTHPAATVLARQAPYGVAYLVATWQPEPGQ
jgi:hypothetical protein